VIWAEFTPVRIATSLLKSASKVARCAVPAGMVLILAPTVSLM
jgi:hypothetical protein